MFFTPRHFRDKEYQISGELYVRKSLISWCVKEDIHLRKCPDEGIEPTDFGIPLVPGGDVVTQDGNSDSHTKAT
jgi:hypothetical protein